MKTIDFEDVLKGVNALWTGVHEAPDTAHYPRMRAMLDLALRVAWQREFWRDLCRTEQRWFRDNWASGTSYSATDEVYDQATQAYYQALQAASGANQSPTDSDGDERSDYWALCQTGYGAANWTSGNSYSVGDQVYYLPTSTYYQCIQATAADDLPSDASYWGALARYDRYIATEQTGKNEIGKMFAVTTADPRHTTNYETLDAWESENGVQVRDEVSECWLRYRQPSARVTGAAFSTTATYAEDDQAYFTPTGGKGNMYTCVTGTDAGESPSSAAAKWSIVNVPLAFGDFLIWHGYGRMMTGDQDNAAKREAFRTAEDFLALAMENERSPGQTPAVPMRTY